MTLFTTLISQLQTNPRFSRSEDLVQETQDRCFHSKFHSSNVLFISLDSNFCTPAKTHWMNSKSLSTHGKIISPATKMCLDYNNCCCHCHCC